MSERSKIFLKNGFCFTGRILSTKDGLIRFLDSKTQKIMLFPLDNVDRIVEANP